MPEARQHTRHWSTYKRHPAQPEAGHQTEHWWDLSCHPELDSGSQDSPHPNPPPQGREGKISE